MAGNRIQEVGTADELFRRNPEIPRVGGDSYLLIPGLINGHGHGKGLTDFQRGSLDDTLESWILGNRKFLPLPVYEDVALCAAKLLKSGVTATMHNHNLQNPADYRQEFEDAIQRENIGAIWYLDDIGVKDRLMVSPAFLRKALFPKMRIVAEGCRKKGIFNPWGSTCTPECWLTPFAGCAALPGGD